MLVFVGSPSCGTGGALENLISTSSSTLTSGACRDFYFSVWPLLIAGKKRKMSVPPLTSGREVVVGHLRWNTTSS